MSQSDYLNHKTISVKLKNQSKLGPILNSQFYTQCKKYAIENEIVNTSIIYGIVTPIIRTNNCPIFILCKDTDKRPNRIQKTRPRCYFSIFRTAVKFHCPISSSSSSFSCLTSTLANFNKLFIIIILFRPFADPLSIFLS